MNMVEWALAGVATSILSVLGYLETTWRRRVNDHMDAGVQDQVRLRSLEDSYRRVGDEVARLTEAVDSLRKDQLDFYRFVYEQLGAKHKAAEIDVKLNGDKHDDRSSSGPETPEGVE